MMKLVFGAKRNEDGTISLAHGGMDFYQGAFAYTDYVEILTGKLRSASGKIKKAKEILEQTTRPYDGAMKGE